MPPKPKGGKDAGKKKKGKLDINLKTFDGTTAATLIHHILLS
jgi:hypothetical protein